MALFVHNGLPVAVLWTLALCVAATAADAWTHPTVPVPPPWQHTQAQEQQLLDAVGGLGKRHGHAPDDEPGDLSTDSSSTDSSWTTRTTAPSPAIFTALGSVGVLSDLSSFFNNLQENLESMENMTPDQRRMVLGGDSPQLLPQAGPGRPMSAPALMTSLRNHRPSFRTRHFVETSEPAALRRSNNHDPQLLWAGIGR
ncbi:uncharacterized protein LOC117643041 [Thrips palmi]|uniref:Uncharacterized protein LOC117643041 n=1 Tax=Thrips palmi TaxID=161013 RepID=A0A6P8ZKR6_THRPL|nr:uncharacterized protein LOC117643041 [Thrips palmi]